MVTRSHDQLAEKKQTETELLQRELNTLGLRDRDQKTKILNLERELSEVRDVLRTCG